jgi:membrane fusion protein (multidrug efflux system)
MEPQNSKRRPENQAHPKKTGMHPGSRSHVNRNARRGHVPPKHHLEKPFIDMNDLEGSADALRKLADQLDSMQSHREHRNLEAYTLPRGHFVKRVNEQMPEEYAKKPLPSKRAKSKKSHDDQSDDDAKHEMNDDESHEEADEEAGEEAGEQTGDDQEDRNQKDGAKETDRKGNKKKKFKFTPGRIAAMAAVILLLVGAAGMFFYHMHVYESTDDALVQAHTTLLAPKVSGIVTQVLVDEHQRVKAGQVLVRIEPKDFSANLDNARANFEAMKVQLKNAKRDLRRASELVRDHAITPQDYDHALATYQDLDRKTRAAMSDVDESELNLAYTEIRAPTDGMIGRKSVEVGMNATAGTALMGFVQNDERWVIANFKETQLSSIKPGKKVKVEVDAIPDREYEGVVESISPSSGATFTLFPPDNATGNFTKVVQRVPVKIFLKNLSEEDMENLQAGLSAVVSVYKQSSGESIPTRPYLTYRSQIGESLPEDATNDSFQANPLNTLGKGLNEPTRNSAPTVAQHDLQQAQEIPLDQQKPREGGCLPKTGRGSSEYGR